jgi:hypothetical protein
MDRISKLLQKLFCKKFGDGSNVGPSAFVALEWRLVWSIEYKDWVDGQGDQSEETVIKGAQSRIRAACS